MIQELPVLRHPAGPPEELDAVAIEEPLELRVDGKPLVVTMRTPGADKELAAGFLYSEGVIDGADDIQAMAHVRDLASSTNNVLDLRLASGAQIPQERFASAQRGFYANSSCGLCGKATIDNVLLKVPPLEQPFCLELPLICTLPKKMEAQQTGFSATGGLHGAALFGRQGELLVLREDIGRHNAVDKVLGWALLHDLTPLDQHILVVSSRASFEITQKALMARISVLASVGAPSSMAVAMARAAGMQLCGFVRGRRCNQYSPAQPQAERGGLP